jgi:uncharacterized protein (TIGR02246 family)
MRITAALALGLMLCVSDPAVGQTGSGDEAAIRRIIQQYDEARSKSDWKTAASLVVEDGSNLTSAGEWRRGRAEIEKGGAATTAGVYKGGKYATNIENVRLLAPTVALADGAFEISNIGGGKSRKGHSTYVLVKSGGSWRIAASRSMVPVPAGPSGTE